MIDFASARFRERPQGQLARHEGFALETRWFDGSIAIESDAATCRLNVDRGRIIVALGSVPPFGFTFELRGSGHFLHDLDGHPELAG